MTQIPSRKQEFESEKLTDGKLLRRPQRNLPLNAQVNLQPEYCCYQEVILLSSRGTKTQICQILSQQATCTPRMLGSV